MTETHVEEAYRALFPAVDPYLLTRMLAKQPLLLFHNSSIWICVFCPLSGEKRKHVEDLGGDSVSGGRILISSIKSPIRDMDMFKIKILFSHVCY